MKDNKLLILKLTYKRGLKFFLNMKKRIYQVVITQILLDATHEETKKHIGEVNVDETNYAWAESEEDAIGQKMANQLEEAGKNSKILEISDKRLVISLEHLVYWGQDDLSVNTMEVKFEAKPM